MSWKDDATTEQVREEFIRVYPITATGGLPLPKTILVDRGWCGVVVQNGKPISLLSDGEHVLEPASPEAASQITLYLVKTAPLEAVQWDIAALFEEEPESAIPDSHLEGRCWMQITDPGRFVAVLLETRSLVEEPPQRAVETVEESRPLPHTPTAAELEAVALRILTQTIEAAASQAVQQQGLRPIEGRLELEPVRAATKETVSRQLYSQGVQCTALRITVAHRQLDYYCTVCHSLDACTALTAFIRRRRGGIGFFTVRIEETTAEGYFCARCALHTCLNYNVTTLLTGWANPLGWLVCSGITLGNCLAWATVLRTRKEPQQHLALARSQTKTP